LFIKFNVVLSNSSVDISVKDPGLTLSSFLNDLISEIIVIIFSTSSIDLSYDNEPSGQLACIKKFLPELSNLFFSQISSVTNGIKG